jgi:hypothetical protein
MTEESDLIFHNEHEDGLLEETGTHKWGNKTLSLGMELKKTAAALSKQETRK